MASKQSQEDDADAAQAAAAVEARAASAADDDAALEGEYQPSGESEQAGQGDPSSEEVVTTLAVVTFRLIATRRGEHWQLSADEAQQIGQAGGAVLDKWAPDMTVGPEATLAVTLGVVLVGRVQQDKAVADAKRREAQDADAQGDAGQGSDAVSEAA